MLPTKIGRARKRGLASGSPLDLVPRGGAYIALAALPAAFSTALAAFSEAFIAMFMALSAAFMAFSAMFSEALAVFSASLEQAARPSEAARTNERAMVLVMGKPFSEIEPVQALWRKAHPLLSLHRDS